MTPHALHKELLRRYGPQGWWPLLGHAGCNPTRTGRLTGYHPGDYSFPRTDRDRFEVCVGAVLTQNTAWTNVEKALAALDALGALAGPQALLDVAPETLRSAIRPSGYFNVKARKLTVLALFIRELAGRCPTRGELLVVWGIGPETADSILLYAYAQPEVVVDAYTRRIFACLGMAAATASYATLKALIDSSLPASVADRQEFHALLVEHAKRHYRRAPFTDPLR